MYQPRTQKGVYGNLVVWVLGILLVVVVVGLAVGIVRWTTAPVAGKLEARRQINSGATRIGAYEHFYDLCAAVQALEAALAAQQQELQGSVGDDAERIRANIAGVTAGRARAIAEYNADARKSYTIGQFRASDLPYQLDPRQEETTCVA